MITGFESYKDGCPDTTPSGIGNGIDFGMGSSGSVVISFADDYAIFHNNRTHTGIRRSPALSFFRLVNGKMHKLSISALHAEKFQS